MIWGKVFSLIIRVGLCTIAALTIHEWFHVVAGKAVGLGDGLVQFSLSAGWYLWPSEANGTQNLIVRLAGGIGTGTLFLVGWGFSHWQMKYSKWEIDDAFAFLWIGLSQIIYLPFDLFMWSGGQIVPIAASAAIVLIVYWRRLVAWLAR